LPNNTVKLTDLLGDSHDEEEKESGQIGQLVLAGATRSENQDDELLVGRPVGGQLKKEEQGVTQFQLLVNQSELRVVPK